MSSSSSNNNRGRISYRFFLASGREKGVFREKNRRAEAFSGCRKGEKGISLMFAFLEVKQQNNVFIHSFSA
jgi:hypothetical protein